MENFDFKRCKKLLIIGLIGTFLGIIADFLLAYNKYDETLDGFYKYLSLFNNLSESRFILSNILGIIGQILQILSLFSIFRIIDYKNKKLAHIYRSGIILMSISGPIGGHSLPISMFYFYSKVNLLIDSSILLNIVNNFVFIFIFNAIFLYLVGLIIVIITQFIALFKNKTFLPRSSSIFSIFLALPIYILFILLPNNEFVNAMMFTSLNLGFLFMYLGVYFSLIKLESSINKKNTI